MENGIIVVVIIVLVFAGVRSGIRHMKGQGGCCGGGSAVKPKKKKLKNILEQKVVIIEGMVCDNCKNRVEMCINDLDGVAAKVYRSKNMAVVSLEKRIDGEVLRQAIEKEGYKVVEIRRGRQ